MSAKTVNNRSGCFVMGKTVDQGLGSVFSSQVERALMIFRERKYVH